MSKDVIRDKKSVRSDGILGDSGFDHTKSSAPPPSLQLTASGSSLQLTGDSKRDSLMAGFAETTGQDLSDTKIEFNNTTDTSANGAIAMHTPGKIVTSESPSQFFSDSGTGAHELAHEADVRMNGVPEATGTTEAGNPVADSREHVADSMGATAAKVGSKLV